MNIQNIKKVELHLHLDGSLRPSTVLELAKKDDIELPTYDLNKLKKYLSVDEHNKDLVEYLKKFEIPGKVMQTKENLSRVSYELVEDLAKDNYIYAEIRFAPHFHLEKGLNLEEVVEAVLKGIEKATKKYDIKITLLLCIMRHLSLEKAFEILNLTEKYIGKGVSGLDLAGDEFNYPATIFKKVFNVARNKGIPFTIHAGEARGPESVWEAISLGAKRLGHGIRSYEDERLIDCLKKEDIALECCPISNLHTHAIKDFRNYPLKFYVENNINACLNTDNRTVSNTNYQKEVDFLSSYINIDLEDINKFNKNAIKSAFITEDEKKQLLNKLK
ncbi:adenosine deaminase [Hypnocyclicus thermotrophus]|uniref:Adenosine deaminase n=1 Tax=Hypnocyclicus thermotrophus TaxID=1627895 RepID=A0AA46E0F5_9FUSO|nr:adenosine deaminase [Hypnocyclicus thermotrophus]TDT72466.1 adenosine deaminase [Hypnocyclicus thermotrophus]